MSDLLPNFLHIGPSKSGSTWLHEVLILHPEIYLSQAKDLYFFSRYYDRGPGWYRSQFRDVQKEHKIIGEFSPDYLACAEAAERIRDCLGPGIRLMVTLREPASRAFSSYLYLQKHGLAAPTFRQTALSRPDLLDHGRYATNLRRYLSYFGRKSLLLSLFDDLEADPQAFLDGVTTWLGVARRPVSPELLEARLPARRGGSRSRSSPSRAPTWRGASTGRVWSAGSSARPSWTGCCTSRWAMTGRPCPPKTWPLSASNSTGRSPGSRASSAFRCGAAGTGVEARLAAWLGYEPSWRRGL